MFDVRGVEIQPGQNILYTESGDGTFRKGTVVRLTEKVVYIQTEFTWRGPTRKDPKFIVVV